MLVRYRLTILAAATFACAAPAHAATLVNSGGTLTYTAAAGGFSDLSIEQSPAPDNTVNVERNGGDSDVITPRAARSTRRATCSPAPVFPPS